MPDGKCSNITLWLVTLKVSYFNKSYLTCSNILQPRWDITFNGIIAALCKRRIPCIHPVWWDRPQQTTATPLRHEIGKIMDYGWCYWNNAAKKTCRFHCLCITHSQAQKTQSGLNSKLFTKRQILTLKLELAHMSVVLIHCSQIRITKLMIPVAKIIMQIWQLLYI